LSVSRVLFSVSNYNVVN